MSLPRLNQDLKLPEVEAKLVLGSKEMPFSIDFEKKQHKVQKPVFHYLSSLILDAQHLVWSDVAAFDLKSGSN